MFTRHENKGKYFRGRGRGRHKFSQGRNHENFKEERKDGETSHKEGTITTSDVSLTIEALKMVYLGNEQGSKAYRLFDPTTQRVCVSRDVKFKENETWDWKDYISGALDDHDAYTPSAPPFLYSDGPKYDASSHGPWHSLIAFEACVRVCEVAWAKGCKEALTFLENGYALLRSTFGVQQFLLQSKEELLVKRASEGGSKGGVPKPKKMVGKMDVQVDSVTETVAYDIVLEAAMKVQNFHQRNLVLQNTWKWLLIEFASYYGVSDAYTKLRYLSYIMDVATPTAECLSLVYDLLSPVMKKGHKRSTLSHQENQILGQIKEQIEKTLAVVFKNYKSLDENSPTGMIDVFRRATVEAPPVLEHAVKLYKLTNDILSLEAQKKLHSYFEDAAKKRFRHHLTETDEYVSRNGEGILLDPITAYRKMKSLCLNIRNEIFTDSYYVKSSFIDLPNLSSAIYCAELSSRLRAFLVACFPAAPSPHVTDLAVATAEFQNDLASWNVNLVKHGFDARVLFHSYIMIWIKEKRLYLLETCKLDKVKWSGARTLHPTTPFVDEMYDQLKEAFNDYEVIIRLWPDYSVTLGNAVADIEKAVIEALDKQYADVVAPLKENTTPKKFWLFTKRTTTPYTAPPELGVLLNSMERMLDVVIPKIHKLTRMIRRSGRIEQIESQIISERKGKMLTGNLVEEQSTTQSNTDLYTDRDISILVNIRLGNMTGLEVDTTRLQNGTKLKKILQDSKKSVGDSEIRSRMEPLIEQLKNTMNHLHKILETPVFIPTCREYWDRMGQDVLSFLAKKKENRSWYKGSRVAVSILDDTFASQMQQLLGNTFQEKDTEPPESIVAVHSMLCKDAGSYKNPVIGCYGGAKLWRENCRWRTTPWWKKSTGKKTHGEEEDD
ncbi:hypothetical protein Tco_1377730 [Tanacetum coccineum]